MLSDRKAQQKSKAKKRNEQEKDSGDQPAKCVDPVVKAEMNINDWNMVDWLRLQPHSLCVASSCSSKTQNPRREVLPIARQTDSGPNKQTSRLTDKRQTNTLAQQGDILTDR